MALDKKSAHDKEVDKANKEVLDPRNLYLAEVSLLNSLFHFLLKVSSLCCVFKSAVVYLWKKIYLLCGWIYFSQIFNRKVILRRELRLQKEFQLVTCWNAKCEYFIHDVRLYFFPAGLDHVNLKCKMRTILRLLVACMVNMYFYRWCLDDAFVGHWGKHFYSSWVSL